MSSSLNLAYARGWTLALTLMVTIVVFEVGDGGYGVVLAAKYDATAPLSFTCLIPTAADFPQ